VATAAWQLCGGGGSLAGCSGAGTLAAAAAARLRIPPQNKKQLLAAVVHSLRMGWRNFFSSCAVVSVFWFLAGNRFWCYLLAYLEYNTVVARVVYRFGIFGRYLVGISWYLLNPYQRKTWSVHVGIIILVGTPFFLERGVMAPFFRGPAPILRKKGFPAKP
jgi:hypothetical protein